MENTETLTTFIQIFGSAGGTFAVGWMWMRDVIKDRERIRADRDNLREQITKFQNALIEEYKNEKVPK